VLGPRAGLAFFDPFEVIFGFRRCLAVRVDLDHPAVSLGGFFQLTAILEYFAHS
jgi:hypothetical protein